METGWDNAGLATCSCDILCFLLCPPLLSSYEVEGCEVVWAVKDKAIGNSFFDAGAAQFLIPALGANKPERAVPCKRSRYTTEEPAPWRTQVFTAGFYHTFVMTPFLFLHNTVAGLLVFMCKCPDGKAQRLSCGPTEAGSALGPDWHEGLVLQGAEQVTIVTGLLSVCLKMGKKGNWVGHFCSRK